MVAQNTTVVQTLALETCVLDPTVVVAEPGILAHMRDMFLVPASVQVAALDRLAESAVPIDRFLARGLL